MWGAEVNRTPTIRPTLALWYDPPFSFRLSISHSHSTSSPRIRPLLLISVRAIPLSPSPAATIVSPTTFVVASKDLSTESDKNWIGSSRKEGAQDTLFLDFPELAIFGHSVARFGSGTDDGKVFLLLHFLSVEHIPNDAGS